MFYLDTTSYTQIFEAKSLCDLSDQVSEYYAQDWEDVCQIEAVYFQNDLGVRSALSSKDLELFIADCEDNNQNLRNEMELDNQYQQQMKSDYYANIL